VDDLVGVGVAIRVRVGVGVGVGVVGVGVGYSCAASPVGSRRGATYCLVLTT
jgi:hypothetical protein